MLHRLPRQGDILVGYGCTEPRRVLGWAPYDLAKKICSVNDRSITGLAKECSTTNDTMLLDCLNGDGVFYHMDYKGDTLSTYMLYHHQLVDELYSKLMED